MTTRRRSHPVGAAATKTRTLSGRFKLTTNVNPLNGNPNTGIFDPLIAVWFRHRLSFTIASELLVMDPFSGDKTRTITTGPVTIQFSGKANPLLASTIPATLNGASLMLRLCARAGTVVMEGFNLVGPPSTQYFGFELDGGQTGLNVDASGFPLLGPFDIANSTAMLRRYVTPFAMTDFAMGSSSIRFK